MFIKDCKFVYKKLNKKKITEKMKIINITRNGGKT